MKLFREKQNIFQGINFMHYSKLSALEFLMLKNPYKRKTTEVPFLNNIQFFLHSIQFWLHVVTKTNSLMTQSNV